MPVSYIPSAEQETTRQKQTARKRRRNQNTEIDELADLLPIKHPSLSPSSVTSLMPTGKSPGIDKISVLRLTSAYLKFQNYLEKDNVTSSSSVDHSSVGDLISDALDGFLLVLDKEGTILFASESITTVVGLTQHDVIGQNLTDITDDDDAAIINENLQPKTTPLPTHLNGRTEMQRRQFYVRIKSTVTPGRMQLSRFKSQIMIQVSGNLKIFVPFQSEIESRKNGKKPQASPQVLGFVGECRPIESSSSILELSSPQSNFTSTISLDLKIISVEASVKDVVGYNPDDFVGTRMADYFHPADCKSLIPCENMLMNMGQAVSPVFRFMTSSGDWVWMQMEGMLRYKQGTDEPQFWEVKAKLISQEDGKMKFVEHKELYVSSTDPDQDMLCPHRDQTIMALLADPDKMCARGSGAIVDSLRSAQVSPSLMNSVLHGREMGLKQLPETVKRVLKQNEADDFVIERNKRMGWPMPPHYAQTTTSDQMETGPSPLETQSTMAPGVGNQINVVTPTALSVINGGSSADVGVLNHRPSEDSLDSLVSSLTSSVSSPFDADSTNVYSPLEVHSLTSPPSVNDSVFTPDSRLSRPSPGSTHYSSLSSVVSPPSSVLSGSSNGLHTQFNHSSVNGLSSGYSFSPNSVLSATTHSPTNAQPSNHAHSLDTHNHPSTNTFTNLANAYTSIHPNPQNTLAPNAQDIYTNGTIYDPTLFHQSSLPLQNGLLDSGAGNVANHAVYEFSAGRQVASTNGLSSSHTTSVPPSHSSVLSPSQHIHSNVPSPVSNVSSPRSAYSPHPSHTSDSSITYDPQRVANSSSLAHTNGTGGDQTLEQILSEVIELNSFSGSVVGRNKAANSQGTISVECEVHADTTFNGGLMNGGVAMGNTEVDDILQQFL